MSVVDPSDGRAASRSQHTVSISSATRGPWIAALLVILAFFGVGGVFASQAGLATSVMGTGRVVAEGQRRAVQAPELSRVEAIYSQEGDRVEAGELVIQLDTRDVALAFENTRQQLRRAAASEARLLAEQAGAVDIRWQHQSLADHEQDSAVGMVVENERALFVDRREAREARAVVLERRIDQLEAQIKGEETVLDSLDERFAIVLAELTDYESLAESGLATRPRLEALRRELAELRGIIGATTATISRLQETIGETRLQIQSQETDFREEVSQALLQAQVERGTLEQEFAELELRLERRRLQASVTGRIINLKHTGPGPVVAPGEMLFEIVPELDRVLVETSVRPSDIDAIDVGMEARVVFSAISLHQNRSTTGALISVSPDVFLDERQNAEFFRATIEIPAANVARDVPELDLIIGMPTETYFVSGEKTLLGYLAEPIMRVLDRGLRE